MKINGKELFNINSIREYENKFRKKLQEAINKIEALKADIEKLEIEIDKAMEADILEGSPSTKKELANLQARKANVINQLNDEVKKAEKIKQIMDRGLAEIIPEVSKQIAEDKHTYFNIVEKEIYRRLAEIREQQAELLLLLQLARNTVHNEITEYDNVCEVFNLDSYKKGVSFPHNNPIVPHKSYPEYGSPLLNLTSISAIESVLMRARADANAMYNSGKVEDEKEQLPRAKTFADIELQKFLDSLGE